MAAMQGVSSVRAILAQRISALRRQRGMTQEELSVVTGITRSHISAIEHGRCNIRLDNIDRIAHALGVSIHQLFDEQGGDDTDGHPCPSLSIREPRGRYRTARPVPAFTPAAAAA